MPETPSDETIRRMAKARVEFRQHAVAYALINVLLVGVWWFTGGPGTYYWPVWVHLGWGIGLAFSAYHAYGPGPDAVAREEERLRAKYGKAP